MPTAMMKRAIYNWLGEVKRERHLPSKKIKLNHNKRLNATQYDMACRLCDVITAVLETGERNVPGGIFWSEVGSTGAHSLHIRKNREEIDHSMLLCNRFRDVPTIIYEFDELTPSPDFWVRRYQRLVQELPKKWHVRMPKYFGEVGWNYKGFPVNRHLSFIQERVNAQLCLGMEALLTRRATGRVLEIGGGSGEMAYTVCKAAPGITWYDCDLAQSLVYNAMHMAIWMPRKRHYIYVGNLPVSGIDESLVLRSAQHAATVNNAVVNIPHFLLQDFTGKFSIDLALNAWSFSEMPADQVQGYGDFIKNHLLPGGLLIEQNGVHAEKGGCNAKEILAELFPYSVRNGPLLDRQNDWIIHGGQIDAWSLYPIQLPNDPPLDGFNDLGDTPEITEIPPQHYNLLAQILGPNARVF